MDDETTQEPGWRASQPTDDQAEIQRLTNKDQESPTSSGNPFTNRDSAKASTSRSPNTNKTSSSQDSDSDSTAAPVPFAELVAEGLKLAAIGASFVTRKTFGYNLAMNDTEARRLAKPIARVIARRFRVTKDFADATDVVGAGGGFMTWLNRVISSQEARGQAVAAPQQTFITPDHVPAAPPAPSSTLLSDEAAPQRAAEVSGDRDGTPVVGSGPAKGVFLAGFEEL